MERVIYGAPRYMDWVAQIKVGAATVRVHFTGGALTVYGVTPAQFATTNEVIQKAIEMSAYFKEGRIVELKRVTLPGSVGDRKGKRPPKRTERNRAREKEAAGANTDAEPAERDGEKSGCRPHTAPDDEEMLAEAEAEVAGAPEPASELESGPDPGIESSIESGCRPHTASDELIRVEVSCLQDAQDYLQQHFNISSYKVRSNVAAQRAGAEHGVEFVGGKFAALDNAGTEGEA